MTPLRIFHSADWHIGKGLGTIDRTDDFRVFLNHFIDQVRERRPDVILIAGDLFDTSMPANSAQRLYYDFIRALEGTSVRATVIAAGNHDSQRFLEAPRALLETMRCFIAGDTPENQTFILRNDEGTPCLAIAAVPYLREGDVRAGTMDDSESDRAERFEAGVRAHYEAVNALLEDELQGCRIPKIAMGHLFVTGSRLRPEGDPIDRSDRPTVGSLRNVTADAFGTNWDYVALGHIHNSQTVDAKVPMRYSGSPISLSYSHIRYKHHIVELTFDEAGKLTIEELPVPQPRAFIRVSGRLDELRAGIKNAGQLHDHPFVEATLTSDECLPELASELTAFGDSCGVIVTAVRNARAAQRYAESDEHAPDLSALTPTAVFRSFLSERFDDEKTAEDRFRTLEPLFNEIVSEIAIHARPKNDTDPTPAERKED